MGHNPGRLPNVGLLLSSTGITDSSSFLARMCDAVNRAVPRREAHLSLGTQSLYWLADVNRADRLHDWHQSPAPPEVELMPPDPKPPA